MQLGPVQIGNGTSSRTPEADLACSTVSDFSFSGTSVACPMEVLANHDTLGGGCASVVANIQHTTTTEWEDFWNDEDVKMNAAAMKHESNHTTVEDEQMQVRNSSFLTFHSIMVLSVFYPSSLQGKEALQWAAGQAEISFGICVDRHASDSKEVDLQAHRPCHLGAC